jgi:hypothetical protein
MSTGDKADRLRRLMQGEPAITPIESEPDQTTDLVEQAEPPKQQSMSDLIRQAARPATDPNMSMSDLIRQAARPPADPSLSMSDRIRRAAGRPLAKDNDNDPGQ